MAESKYTRTMEKQFVVTAERGSLDAALPAALKALNDRAEENGYISQQYVPKTLLFTTVRTVSKNDKGDERLVWSTEASAVFWIVAVA